MNNKDINTGWIKLYRTITESKIWASPEGLKIWLWILMKAHHSDKPLFCELRTGKGKTTVKIFQGQFIFGRKKASEELNLSEKIVRNWIKKLASPEYSMILVQPKSHFSIIQVVNWRDYQVTKGPGKGQPMATYKNDNNVKKILETKDLDPKADEKVAKLQTGTLNLPSGKLSLPDREPTTAKVDIVNNNNIKLNPKVEMSFNTNLGAESLIDTSDFFDEYSLIKKPIIEVVNLKKKNRY